MNPNPSYRRTKDKQFLFFVSLTLRYGGSSSCRVKDREKGDNTRVEGWGELYVQQLTSAHIMCICVIFCHYEVSFGEWM